MIESDYILNKLDSEDEKVLLNSNISKTKFDDVEIMDYIIIDEMSEFRMDIISKAAYGDTKHINVIAKFNGIGNPFSIKIGDILALPVLSSYNANTETINLKDIQGQQSGNLGRTSGQGDGSKSSPSKKTKPSPNFTKSDTGIIVF